MVGRPILAVLSAVLVASGCGSTLQGRAAVTTGSVAAPTAGSSTNAGLQAPNSSSSAGRQQLPSGGNAPVTGAAANGQPGATASGGNPAGDAAVGKTGALSIGFLNTDNSAINSEYGYHFTQGEDMDRALVAGINATGGLAGHKLVGHYATYSADSNNYASDMAAACQTFTVDTPVSVVASSPISTEYGFADCLQRKSILELSSSWTDAHNLSSHPLLFLPAGSSFEHAYVTAINQLHASGNLTSKNHLGVVLEGCPEDQRAWTNGIQPDIKRLGIPVELTTLSCTGGIQDAGAASAAMKNAILRWQTAGVDRVVFVTIYESTLLVLFAPEATSQDFHPGYVLTSNADASSVAAGGTFPSDQDAGLRGAGTLPGYDVDAPPKPTAVENRCLAWSLKGGLELSASFDRETLYLHCASLIVLEAALNGSPPTATTADMRSAIEGLGSNVALPGLLDGRSQLTAGRHDGPTYAREFGWKSDCSCVMYLAAAAPMSG